MNNNGGQSDAITQFMAETRSSIRNLENQMGQLAETKSSMRSLETQIEQLATLLSNRAPGSLPSTTEVNPKENCKAITLRSGTNYQGPSVRRLGSKGRGKSTSRGSTREREDY